MNALFNAAQEVSDFLTSRGWEHCIIGGLAVQRWGEPRTTLNVDITLLTEWGEEERYVTAILDRFGARIPDAHAFALTRRVLLIQASNGKGVDISLGALPYEVGMVRRAVNIEFAPGLTLPCCTPEDLFIMKMFAERPRDWSDAETVVARQERLDQDYILEHLTELCTLKEAPEILDRAKELLARQP